MDKGPEGERERGTSRSSAPSSCLGKTAVPHTFSSSPFPSSPFPNGLHTPPPALSSEGGALSSGHSGWSRFAGKLF